MSHRLVLCCITSCLLLSCSQEVLVEPTSTVHVRGIVRSTPLVPDAPGTHVLTEESSSKQYYLESKEFSLRSYEGVEVSIEGLATSHAKRTHPIIKNISILATHNEQSVQHTFPEFSITLPKSFKVSHSGSDISMFAFAKKEPVFTISAATLPFPSGTPVLLGSTKAVQVAHGAVQNIYVSINSTGYVFEFTELADQLQLQSVWNSMIKSVVLHAAVSSASKAYSATGVIIDTTAKKPCGGTAGILCDAGYYCKISDMVHHVGQCYPL